MPPFTSSSIGDNRLQMSQFAYLVQAASSIEESIRHSSVYKIITLSSAVIPMNQAYFFQSSA